MATNTAALSPAVRQDQRNVVNTLVKTINYNDADIAAAAFANSLPMGARILAVMVEIITAFNAGGSNTLTVGTNSATYNDLVAAADVNELVAGTTMVTRGLGGSILRSAALTPYAVYTAVGAAASAGKAEITISYEGGWTN